MENQDSSLPAEEPLQSQQVIEDLERQVAEAQAELEQYQGLLNELPGIYEDKFRQKLRSVAEEIRHLLDERKALQEQVSRALVQPRAPEALPQAAANSPRAGHTAPNWWPNVRLPRFPAPASSFPPFRLSRLEFRFSIPRGRQRGVALGAGVLLALLVLGLPQLLSRRSVPAAGSPPASAGGQRLPVATSANLRLEARGGQSWVLVTRLDGGSVYGAIMEPGQSKVLPLGSGLKIKSGRSDLLYVGTGQGPAKPLGAVSDLDWFEFRP
jgi:hypothetical protein